MSKQVQDAYIVAATRTPIGKSGRGYFKNTRPDDLLIAVESRLNRHKVLNDMFDDAMSTMKRNILTILNHEFRTPLTFVVAYADMLNDQTQRLSDEELLAFLRGVNTGALRLRRLIENFIQLVEMETGDAQGTHGPGAALPGEPGTPMGLGPPGVGATCGEPVS